MLRSASVIISKTAPYGSVWTERRVPPPASALLFRTRSSSETSPQSPCAWRHRAFLTVSTSTHQSILTVRVMLQRGTIPFGTGPMYKIMIYELAGKSTFVRGAVRLPPSERTGRSQRLGERGGTTSTGMGWNDLDRPVKWEEGRSEE